MAEISLEKQRLLDEARNTRRNMPLAERKKWVEIAARIVRESYEAVEASNIKPPQALVEAYLARRKQ